MFNVNQSLGGRAGNVYLPRVSMDRGYIQYGIGFTKQFTDTFSGYFQAVLRNVGRTGGAFQAGFSWKIGKKPFGNKESFKAKTPELKPAKVPLNSKNI